MGLRADVCGVPVTVLGSVQAESLAVPHAVPAC